MEYLAHVNAEGEKQLLEDHLENTAVLCGKFADSFGMYDWGYCCGKLHDIGKYSNGFQERIRGSEKQVDHSTAGAKLLWEQKGIYQFISYCIAGHHAGLPDTGASSDVSTRGTLLGRMKKSLENYEEYTNKILIPKISPPAFQIKKSENTGFMFSMMIRMIFSCLVDADYLDTENFMNGGRTIRNKGDTIENLSKKLDQYVSGWIKNNNPDTINGRRTEILKNCMEKGKADQGLFTMTVPTGGGKTVASLAFALKHAEIHKLNRIIYVIPYISIIEQNARVFRDILGEENVLENHCNVEYEEAEELESMHLAAENWDKPVIVTTNVQFFESLFSNKTSKCRKLHNIANSVIIFDEAQMLPADYLKPCIAVMEQLVRHYRSSIVLCTATQPALQGIFAEDFRGMELCPRLENQFDFFRRASIENLGKIPEDILLDRLTEEHQVLCILNTKKRAQRVYQSIKKEGVYHLSTSMYPVHRRRVLKDIRQRLADGRTCIVISTSLVEAGVDLDFITVYRQLAGMDSIIQAAGRCNREGKRKIEDSHTYIFQFEEKEYTPGQCLQMEISDSLLKEKRKPDDLNTIQQYFKMLYHFREEELDKKKIVEAFQQGDFPFARIGREVKLIEENTKTILIPKEEKAKELLREIQLKGVTRKLMRELGKYCVNVYETDWKKMSGAGMLQNLSEELQEEYFVLYDLEKYTEEMGLKLDTEYGAAVFF